MNKKEKFKLNSLLWEHEILCSVARDYEKNGLSSLDGHSRNTYFLLIGKCLGLEIVLEKFNVPFDSIHD